MRPGASSHYFYILGGQPSPERGPTKIGVSRDVPARMRLLQTGCPFELHAMHSFSFPDKTIAHYVEGHFIKVEAPVRLRGDWFAMHPIVALMRATAYINAILEIHLAHMGEDHIEKWRVLSGLNEARQKLIPMGVHL